MSENLKALTTQAAPWNKQIAWWIVVVEGVLACALGLFVLLQPQQANARLIQIIGGYLAVMSGMALYRVLAHKDETLGTTSGYVRNGIGLVAGLIALFNPWLSMVSAMGAAVILALGMAISAIINLYGFFTTPNQAERKWGDLIVDFLYLIFAYMVLVHNNSEYSGALLWWIGLLTTLAGVGLVIYGILLYRKEKAALAAAPAAAPAPGQPSASPAPVAKAPAVAEKSPNKTPTNGAQ